MTSHVTGHVISPIVHVTVSRKLLHFDSLMVVRGDDGVGSHGDDLHVLSTHKHVDPACPHTDSPFRGNMNDGTVRDSVANEEGLPRPSS